MQFSSFRKPIAALNSFLSKFASFITSLNVFGDFSMTFKNLFSGIPIFAYFNPSSVALNLCLMSSNM